MPRDFLIARHKRSFVIRIILRHFIVPCSRRRFHTIYHMQKAIQHKLNRFEMVEVTGFEPATFWSRTKRATKLRYTSKMEPMKGLEPLTCGLRNRCSTD